MKKIIAAAIFAVSLTANSQELACTKIGFEPGTPNPNRCFVVVSDSAKPAKKPKPVKPGAAPMPKPIEVVEVVPDTSAQFRKEAFSGIAQAAALVPLMPSQGKTTLNLGAANFGGQSALGLTIAHRVNGFVLSGGASVGTSGPGLVRVSAGFEF